MWGHPAQIHCSCLKDGDSSPERVSAYICDTQQKGFGPLCPLLLSLEARLHFERSSLGISSPRGGREHLITPNGASKPQRAVGGECQPQLLWLIWGTSNHSGFSCPSSKCLLLLDASTGKGTPPALFEI